MGGNPVNFLDSHGLLNTAPVHLGGGGSPGGSSGAIGAVGGGAAKGFAGSVGFGVGAWGAYQVWDGYSSESSEAGASGDTTKTEQCTDSSCPPCTPYVNGTIGYIGPHTDHDHFPIGRPHLNLFQVNQNPKDCKCHWNRATPDYAPPPPQPAWVNLNGGFPPLSP